MYHHILIALEGKPTDEAAIAHAIDLAVQNSARVTALRIIAIAADDSGMRHLQMEEGASGWRRKKAAEARLASLQARLRGNGHAAEVALVVSDRGEADEIVDYAIENQCALIVMAADGRPWWQRALFGCIADGVHRKATVPTLFVSDGTRRARLAARYKPPLINPFLDAFSHAEVC